VSAYGGRLLRTSGKFGPAPEGTGPRRRPRQSVIFHALGQGNSEHQSTGGVPICNKSAISKIVYEVGIAPEIDETTKFKIQTFVSVKMALD
jgi:hypothetical protein